MRTLAALLVPAATGLGLFTGDPITAALRTCREHRFALATTASQAAARAVALAERPGDRLAEALTAQAEVLLRRGNYGAAKAVIERAVAAADHAGQPQQQALAHLVFAEIEVRSAASVPARSTSAWPGGAWVPSWRTNRVAPSNCCRASATCAAATSPRPWITSMPH